MKMIKTITMKLKLSFYIIFLLSVFNVQAQVTIGSGIPPRNGSLLDLKQNEKSGKIPNTNNKGLGLPRVNLSSLTDLTVDVNYKGMDYVGLMVYNMAGSVKEGIYYWDGNTWLQAIAVDENGSGGNMLKSNGDGTYRWGSVTFPQYSYYKPTNIAIYKRENATTTGFKFSDVAPSDGTVPGTDPNARKPKPGTFDDNYIYRDVLNIQTPASKEKYMLLALTVLTDKTTIEDKVLKMSFYEIIELDILIDGISKKKYQRTVSRPANASPYVVLDLFSIIPLTGLSEGQHQLQIRVSIIENSYRNNVKKGKENGYFDTDDPVFLRTKMSDIGIVVYEND